MSKKLTRRELAAAASFLIVPRHVLGGPGQTAPSDRLNVASIGLGRQGMFVTMDLLARPDVQLVAVCDVNKGAKNYVEYSENATLRAARKLLGPGYESWGEDLASPGFAQLSHEFRTSLGMGGREPAKRVVEAYYAGHKPSGNYKGCAEYSDFRELLDKQSGLDAVYIATPDHWHAPIAIAAMKKGKHVLGQKPMAHSIADARRMAQTAQEMKVTGSLPVNNPSTPDTKLIASWIAGGAIGRLREVHNWSSRPFWPQGMPPPAETQPVPDGLDWDMWLGPASPRPFNALYQPFVWRGFVDFGCGSFGDMGCYSFAGVFKILDLTPPTSVESSTSGSYDETYPKASMVHMDFPTHNGRPEVRFSWYDGGLKPTRPKGIRKDDERKWGARGEGILYVGDKGIILGGFNGESPRLYPESDKYVSPPPERGEEHDYAVDQWVLASRGAGPAPLAAFESQVAPTEAFLLGCIAQRMPGQRLDWDTTAMKITSSEAANKLIDPPKRGQG